MKKYDYTVFIGRFQPCHMSHIKIIEKALEFSEHLIILIGSSYQPRTVKNPWKWDERERMIRSSLPKEVQFKISIAPLRDHMYNDQQWVKNVQTQVEQIKKQRNVNSDSTAIVGHVKDSSSYYLEMFPQWELVDIDNIQDLHATDIRKAYFEMDTNDDQSLMRFEQQVGKHLPKGIHDYLKAFQMCEEYEKLVNEYNFIEKYKKSWETAPYPPTFVTVDAVVVQSGHVLLVQRRAEPGKGTWACSGGFIGQNETLEDSMLRELKEETKIKVPKPVLKGNIKAREVYDAPNRSLRGRTITHAFLIELPPGKLSKVKGGDDASKAKWVPISMFDRMEEQMFEDHYFIINDMLGKL